MEEGRGGAEKGLMEEGLECRKEGVDGGERGREEVEGFDTYITCN